jgi:hypothetical protein
MAKKPTTAKAPKRARQTALPGMQDKPIAVLEDIAHEYAEVRDQRMALLQQEVTLKQRALAELHKLKRTAYRQNGIEITIIPGDESIRVKVKPPAEADDAIEAE